MEGITTFRGEYARNTNASSAMNKPRIDRMPHKPVGAGGDNHPLRWHEPNAPTKAKPRIDRTATDATARPLVTTDETRGTPR